MKVKVFGSFEEMMDEMESAQIEADSNSKSWQGKLKPGDKFVRYISGIWIYSEVLDVAREEEEAGASPEEVEYIRNLYSQPHMTNYRFTRSYSCDCVEGELGDVHISQVVSKLSDKQFIKAKNDGWPEFIVRN